MKLVPGTFCRREMQGRNSTDTISRLSKNNWIRRYAPLDKNSWEGMLIAGKISRTASLLWCCGKNGDAVERMAWPQFDKRSDAQSYVQSYADFWAGGSGFFWSSKGSSKFSGGCQSFFEFTQDSFNLHFCFILFRAQICYIIAIKMKISKLSSCKKSAS